MDLTPKQKSRSMKTIREAKRYSSNLIQKVQLSQILNIILQRTSHASTQKSVSVAMRSSRMLIPGNNVTSPRSMVGQRRRKISNYTTKTNNVSTNNERIGNKVRVESEGFSLQSESDKELKKSYVLTGIHTPVPRSIRDSSVTKMSETIERNFMKKPYGRRSSLMLNNQLMVPKNSQAAGPKTSQVSLKNSFVSQLGPPRVSDTSYRMNNPGNDVSHAGQRPSQNLTYDHGGERVTRREITISRQQYGTVEKKNRVSQASPDTISRNTKRISQLGPRGRSRSRETSVIMFGSRDVSREPSRGRIVIGSRETSVSRKTDLSRRPNRGKIVIGSRDSSASKLQPGTRVNSIRNLTLQSKRPTQARASVRSSSKEGTIKIEQNHTIENIKYSEEIETEKMTVKKTVTEKTEYVPDRIICVTHQPIISPTTIVSGRQASPMRVQVRTASPGPMNMRSNSPTAFNMSSIVSPGSVAQRMASPMREFSPITRRLPPVNHPGPHLQHRISLSPTPVVHHAISVSPIPMAGVSRIKTRITRTEEIEIPKQKKQDLQPMKDKIKVLLLKNMFKIMIQKIQRRRAEGFYKMKCLKKPEEAAPSTQCSDINPKFKGLILHNLMEKHIRSKGIHKFLNRWQQYCERANKRGLRDSKIICSNSRMERFTYLLSRLIENRPLKHSYYAFNQIRLNKILKNIQDYHEVEIVRKFFVRILATQNLKSFMALKLMQHHKNLGERDDDILSSKNAMMESIQLYKDKTSENMDRLVAADRELSLVKLQALIRRKVELQEQRTINTLGKNAAESRGTLERLLMRLASSQRGKTANAFYTLKENTSYHLISESNYIMLNSGFNNLSRLLESNDIENMRDCFGTFKDQFVNSVSLEALTLENKRRALDRLLSCSESKTRQSYQRMVQNSLDYSNKLINVLRLEKILSNKFKNHYYYCFNEIMKSAYKYKEGYRFCSLMEKIFLKTKRSAFDSIFEVSEFRRLEKIHRGLSTLHKIFNIRYLRYRKEFKNLILVKVDTNPWTIRAVRKLTVDAPMNYQSTFWKMREIAKIELNKKGDYLKRKKLLFSFMKIFENLRLKQLGLCFVKIDTTANFMERNTIRSNASRSLNHHRPPKSSKSGAIRAISRILGDDRECPSNASEKSLDRKLKFEKNIGGVNLKLSANY